MTVFEHIVGADRLASRFGGWPSFHDAEVVRLMLDRNGANGPTAEMLVHKTVEGERAFRVTLDPSYGLGARWYAVASSLRT